MIKKARLQPVDEFSRNYKNPVARLTGLWYAILGSQLALNFPLSIFLMINRYIKLTYIVEINFHSSWIYSYIIALKQLVLGVKKS